VTASRSNWGRWGEADQRGALNLSTPEVVRAALGSVREGRVYPLGPPIDHNRGPIVPSRPRPTVLHQRRKTSSGDSGADDYVVLNTHGTTHVDALGHVWAGDRVYNGHPEMTGACGVDTVGGIVGRGVLLDVARLHGKPWLEPGYEITPDELTAAEKAAAPLRPGDVALVRTGYLEEPRWDSEEWNEAWPGVGGDCADWFLDREVIAVGADNHGVETRPAKRGRPLELHLKLLHQAGVFIMELLSLAELSRDGVSEFLFVAAPLRIVGGSGSPISPLAIA
jgi:kynurenine formamidase